MTTETSDLRRPYPLLRRFIGVAGPVFLVFLATLLVVSVLAVRTSVQDVYLGIAQQRASGIAASVRESHPEAWQRLIQRAALGQQDYEALRAAFEKEAEEFRLTRLKVYDTVGYGLFSDIPSDIGKIEAGEALQKVIRAQASALGETKDASGAAYYELYVPFFEDGRFVAVFELYEPIGYLDDLLLTIAAPAALIPMVLLTVLMIVLYQLARHAQRDIDWRTERIAELSGRVERLVSRRAIHAMQNADPGSVPEPRTLECTLFFSDIRRFTDFAERHSPQDVIDRLNQLMRLQVDLLERSGADVDKFVGDAVFARFEGPGREAAAIEAAKAIQGHLKTAGLGLSVGIGIASGTVIAGVIGAADRYDYTVLGDAVNVASRLCSIAGPGEIMIDRTTAEGAAFAAPDWESLAVKGRTGIVDALRIRPAG